MKRILYMVLACCLALALAIGCAPKADKPENGGTAAGEAAGTGGEAVAADTTEIVRLESIDYDEATKGLVLNLTKGEFVPSATEEESEYTITYGDTVKSPLSPDARIDFPMADDLTKSVTITADELTGEFLAFIEQFSDKPLFTMEMDGDAVKTLTYFYLP